MSSPATKSSATITGFKAHLKTELHMTQSDISSNADASDSNSLTHGATYVFDTDTDICGQIAMKETASTHNTCNKQTSFLTYDQMNITSWSFVCLKTYLSEDQSLPKCLRYSALAVHAARQKA